MASERLDHRTAREAVSPVLYQDFSERTSSTTKSPSRFDAIDDDQLVDLWTLARMRFTVVRPCAQPLTVSSTASAASLDGLNSWCSVARRGSPEGSHGAGRRQNPQRLCRSGPDRTSRLSCAVDQRAIAVRPTLDALRHRRSRVFLHAGTCDGWMMSWVSEFQSTTPATRAIGAFLDQMVDNLEDKLTVVEPIRCGSNGPVGVLSMNARWAPDLRLPDVLGRRMVDAPQAPAAARWCSCPRYRPRLVQRLDGQGSSRSYVAAVRQQGVRGCQPVLGEEPLWEELRQRHGVPPAPGWSPSPSAGRQSADAPAEAPLGHADHEHRHRRGQIEPGIDNQRLQVECGRGFLRRRSLRFTHGL